MQSKSEQNIEKIHDKHNPTKLACQFQYNFSTEHTLTHLNVSRTTRGCDQAIFSKNEEKGSSNNFF